jgi:Rrf2 family transcriptional regulator, iron-sulfur cluster assembly transcription factor
MCSARRWSTKNSCAVRSILKLVIHDQHDTVTLTGIFRSQRISLSCLERLFVALRKYQLVVGIRGPGGVYRLAYPLN